LAITSKNTIPDFELLTLSSVKTGFAAGEDVIHRFCRRAKRSAWWWLSWSWPWAWFLKNRL